MLIIFRSYAQNMGYEVTDNSICTWVENGKDICFGDSGGPLTYGNYLVGVASGGMSYCGANETPAVFSLVSKARDWIFSIMVER